ncbi:MAG: aminotransferase class III-fold pyridoxal phosphate-dependent enzyme [Actinomycetota bacterium]|nr:aminotransferase class III-fold pyridoxal phosphate-dependent enzyme [Actinomycetota bacterium]MDK1016604.1 aminotransferase class III-fold pyridoxal phosphate-dependent enzyme [Actinomycetota bacterium]MDK1026289.1 aminotransferase class III-fold pyridoxal phosphate-dependent enzyme [Actinomycetota bacterium]MDK1037333.1 aminotransferase class III-fold pyridoxal phosphate-dependent enzyme [Actinomycetota bacterium]MDK1096188.1 aminotransferase class III-fold pyridoxal phosphate-dependent en
MSDLQKRFQDIIAPVIEFDYPVEIIDGKGSWVTGADGRQYLDFTCGIATSNMGHRPDAVVAAAQNQLNRLWHAGGSYLYDSIVDAAEKIVDVAPDGIEKVLFMNSGAEAVEASVKLARKVSGRQGIITFRGGFHGRTMGSVTYTTSRAKYRQGYHPLLPSTFVTPFPHPYGWGMTQEDANAYALRELEFKFKFEVTPGEIAAFLLEPMQGEGGYYPASSEFIHALRAIADEHGILLIADEVQSGFGRTGDWFTSQVYDVRPDILVMGKAIANGLPLSAVGASAELFDKWPVGSHGTTFGGNPVSCAACAANVDALRDFVPGVNRLSGYAFSRWAEIKEQRHTIGDVRGLGLMIGIELVKEGNEPDTEAFAAIGRHALDAGMFILNCGPDGNVIRFIPPLNVSQDDLDRGIDILADAIEAYEG